MNFQQNYQAGEMRFELTARCNGATRSEFGVADMVCRLSTAGVAYLWET